VLSTSYSAGGDTLAAGDVGLRSIENLVVLNGQSGGYTLGFNGITSNTAKIQAYKSGLPASAVPLPGLATITHNATKYIGMDGAEAATAAAACPFVVPAAGKIVGMRASLGTAPSSTYSYTLTLMKNGSAGTNTFAFTGTAVSGSDSAHSDTVAAGDLVTVKAVDSNASSTAATLGLSLLYIPDPIEASGNLSGVTVYFMAVGT
jgi:hypothetical protein